MAFTATKTARHFLNALAPKEIKPEHTQLSQESAAGKNQETKFKKKQQSNYGQKIAKFIKHRTYGTVPWQFAHRF